MSGRQVPPPDGEATSIECSRLATLRFEGIEKVFLRTRFDAALVEATATGILVASGVRLPLAGLSLAVKACFDVRGWVTDAASAVLAGEPTARADAPLVGALRAAGATVIAHTNMTEFAFGALGINSTTGTPATPLDPAGERVAGGSTSGGAVAVAAGLADIALGTDTSGSVRIPAAFCGVVGFKPSKGILSAQGCIPLSKTFDSPGFIARDVATIQRVVDALGVYAITELALDGDERSVTGLRLAIPAGFATDRCDFAVAVSFERAIDRLARRGAIIIETTFDDLGAPSRIAADAGIIIADAYAWHEPWIRARADLYDPLVGPRIQRGKAVPAHRYVNGIAALERAAATFDRQMAGYDALLTPTVPIAPPRIEDLLADRDTYLRLNALSFSLTELANRIDLPSLSLTFGGAPSKPLGLMVTGRRGDDVHLLSIARRVEAAMAEV